MSLSGKGLGDYARFVRTGMILIVLMGLARFIVGISGVPYERATHLLSITILTLLLCFIYGQKAAASGFGGYLHLLPIVFMLAASMYGFIILAILVEGLGGIHGYFHGQTLAALGGQMAKMEGMDRVHGLNIPGSVLGLSRMNWASHALGQLIAMLVFTVPISWGLASLGFLLSRYVGFLRNAFLLLSAMAILRVLVGAAGVPYAVGTWFTSITILAMALSIFYSYRAPAGGFSSFWQAGLLGALMAVATTLLVIYGIAVTTGLGIPNYFHAPGEGFQPRGMSVSQHILGHLQFSVVGMLVMSFLAGIGFAVGKRRGRVASTQAV